LPAYVGVLIEGITKLLWLGLDEELSVDGKLSAQTAWNA